MKVATPEEMNRIDQRAQTEYGLAGSILMEQAATAALEVLRAQAGQLAGQKVWVFCGKGNNGGDGLALARLLSDAGAKVSAVLISERPEYQGLAGTNLKLAAAHRVKLVDWARLEPTELQQADWLVDALLGTGATGPPRGVTAEAIDLLNELKKPVLALDLPSGIDGTTGQVPGPAVQAQCTVSFGLAKPGLLVYPGAAYCGEVVIKPLGFPEPLLQADSLTINYLTPAELRAWLPQRAATAHKGTAGHTALIAGAAGMTGAAALAALGALRVGSGLVTLGLDPQLPFTEKPLEVMVKSRPELLQQLDTFKALVFGPGLGIDPAGRELLTKLVQQQQVPMLIDADGLNLLAEQPQLITACQTPLILTPHPGELARLTGLTVAEIQADRIGVARHWAGRWKVVLVLKGARTICAAPAGQVYINLTGNPGMATAGSGDVLAGMIGGLLAQGLEPLQASVAGAYLHGLAGDRAAATGMVGMIASDLLAQIPRALKQVQSDEPL